jgi:hypothetical protein
MIVKYFDAFLVVDKSKSKFLLAAIELLNNFENPFSNPFQSPYSQKFNPVIM